MKKAPTNKKVDELRPEYDLSKLKGGGPWKVLRTGKCRDQPCLD